MRFTLAYREIEGKSWHGLHDATTYDFPSAPEPGQLISANESLYQVVKVWNSPDRVPRIFADKVKSAEAALARAGPDQRCDLYRVDLCEDNVKKEALEHLIAVGRDLQSYTGPATDVRTLRRQTWLRGLRKNVDELSSEQASAVVEEVLLAFEKLDNGGALTGVSSKSMIGRVVSVLESELQCMPASQSPPPPSRVAAAVPVEAPPPANPVQPNRGEDLGPGSRDTASRYDIAVVCALNFELDKLKEINDLDWDVIPETAGDPHIYVAARLKSSRGATINIVASCPTHPGLSASAVLATKMILKFKPLMVAVVGIAAGVKGKDRGFGDIIFADKTIDYGTGKVAREKGVTTFKPSPNPLEVESILVTRAKARNRDDDSAAINKKWPAERPNTQLRIHVGPVASGDVVVDDQTAVEKALVNWRKLVGIEMETYAVHRACKDTARPAPVFICVKGVSDFAEKKNDKWQMYAAYTAAAFFIRFVVTEWDDLGLGSGNPSLVQPTR